MEGPTREYEGIIDRSERMMGKIYTQRQPANPPVYAPSSQSHDGIESDFFISGEAQHLIMARLCIPDFNLYACTRISIRSPISVLGDRMVVGAMGQAVSFQKA
jgi:hypothetical protein